MNVQHLKEIREELIDAASEIESASEELKKNPNETQKETKLKKISDKLLKLQSKLSSLGPMPDMGTIQEEKDMHHAITHFLQQTDVEKSAGVIGAAILGVPGIKAFTGDLLRIKMQLEEKAKRVETTEGKGEI